MAYATVQDVRDLYGDETVNILIANRNEDGEDGEPNDHSALERALEHASNEIDSRISVRYSTPLPTVPEMVKMAAVEIAVYRLSNDHNRLSDDIRKRYEDMISWLKDVAAYKANTGVAELDDVVKGSTAAYAAPEALWGTVSRR